jgi:hypothetical protein
VHIYYNSRVIVPVVYIAEMRRLLDIPTHDFLTPSFNLGLLKYSFTTMKSSTPDPYSLKTFMVEWSGVEMSKL